MKLSAEEKAMIEKLRKEKEDRLPKLVGYAKEDLYSIGTEVLNDIRDGMFGWYPSKTEIEGMVEQIFSMEVPAGSEFVCYIENGKESWYDSVYGIENMDAKWACKYLKDIKPAK